MQPAYARIAACITIVRRLHAACNTIVSRRRLPVLERRRSHLMFSAQFVMNIRYSTIAASHVIIKLLRYCQGMQSPLDKNGGGGAQTDRGSSWKN